MARSFPSGRTSDRGTLDGRAAHARPSFIPEATPAVTFENVGVELGGRTIWSDATFTVTQGEFIGLIGANGTGKTTLLRVLLGQLRPLRGRIEVLGAPPRRGNRAIGYVPQRRTLELDLAVRGFDFVMLGLTGHRWGLGWASRDERRTVQEALEAVEALPFADEPVGVLSGGEQQRLLIAQALVTQPRLLLLDEPLASLDLRSQHEIVALVNRICRERQVTVFLVAHDLNRLLGVLDRVIYLLDGCPVAAALEEVIQPELLTRLYRAPVRVVRSTDGERFVIGA
jgi:zinc/manganese transport system ATP-binding protein